MAAPPSVFGARDFFGSTDVMFTILTVCMTYGEMGKMIEFIRYNIAEGYFNYYKRDFVALEARRGGRGGGGFDGFGGSGGSSGSSGGGGGDSLYAWSDFQQATLALFAIGGFFGLIKLSTYYGMSVKIARFTRNGHYAQAAKGTRWLFWWLIIHQTLFAACGITGLIIDGVIVQQEKGQIAKYFDPYYVHYPLNVAWVLLMTITTLTTALVCWQLSAVGKRLKQDALSDEKLHSDSNTPPPNFGIPPANYSAAPGQTYVAPQQQQQQHYQPQAALFNAHPPQQQQQQPYATYAPSPAPAPAASNPYASASSPPPPHQQLQHNHPVAPSKTEGGFNSALLAGLPPAGSASAAPAG